MVKVKLCKQKIASVHLKILVFTVVDRCKIHLLKYTKCFAEIHQIFSVMQIHEILFINEKNVSWRKQSLRKKCPYSELFWSAFFPHFPTFGLNTERYEVCAHTCKSKTMSSFKPIKRSKKKSFSRLTPGVQKVHTYLNKDATFSCTFA